SETDTTAQENGGAHQTWISLQCPNPACGKAYTVRSSCAGKSGRCKCGAVFPIPNVSTPLSGDLTSPVPGQPREEGARRAAGAGGEGLPREEVALREGEDVAEGHVGCIGRGHAGDTGLLPHPGGGPRGAFLPSRLP